MPAENARTTVDEFIAEHNVTIASERVSENPRLNPLPGWARATHWKCILKRRRATRSTFTVYFTHKGQEDAAPTTREVLDSLAVDALQSEPVSIEELASELGGITKEEAAKYLDICKKRANGLRRVLGVGPYATLLHGTKRIINA